jgi:mono/diheme cytochrome c family protein
MKSFTLRTARAQKKAWQPRLLAPLVLGVAGLLALLGVACYAPGYTVDFFTEMHYQQSYRPQEPPRLYPPAQSVPTGGKEIAYTLEQAKGLVNPVPRTPQTLAKAQELFRVNCSICHGPQGRGDGPMADRFSQAGAARPVDFTEQHARSLSDGELFWVLTNGRAFMPRFGPLLTAEERWSLVHFIRSIQEGTPPP